MSISGTINGHPIKLIGVCDIPGYPYVVQYATVAGSVAIEAYNDKGISRSGVPIRNFTDHSEFMEDI